MERTKEYSVVNDTLKALKNQGLSERYFQKDHSFSSAARYDHFDNSPCSGSPDTFFIIAFSGSPVNILLLSAVFFFPGAGGKSC